MSNTTTRKSKRPVFNTTLILISTAAILVGILAGIVAVFFDWGHLPVPDVLGFDLREADNGQAAITQAHDWQSDLIMMDMFMPIMTGFDATRAIRQHPELAATIIIGVSASVAETDTQHILESGCDAALPKPIELTKLLAVLASHLKLEWMYTPLETLSSEPVEPERELIPPPPEELAILYDLARRGNLQAVQERATQLAKLDEKFGPFADKLRQLARQFEDKALVAVIQQYLEKT